MGRGKVYPASAARHLLNPLRWVVQPPGRVVRQMQLRADDRVLELGCGPGWFSPTLAAAVPLGLLVCADGQPPMLQLAASRTAGAPNVSLQAADALRLPFTRGSFDAVLLAHVLGEVSDPVACLVEAARVLDDSGALTVVESRRDSDFIQFDRLVKFAGSAGLRTISRRGPRWEYVARLRPAPGLP